MKKEMYNYFTTKMPEEGCGLIIEREGKEEFIPIENVAEDKEKTFALDPRMWIIFILDESVKIKSVIHSHVTEVGLSEEDKKASDFLNIPYGVMQLPSGEITWTNK